MELEIYLEPLEKDIDECIDVLDNGYDDSNMIANTCREMVANYHNEIKFHEFAYQCTDESLRIILRELKKYKNKVIESNRISLIEEEKKSKQDDIELYKMEIKYYKEKINSIENKLDKLINSMPNINIVNSMAQSQEVATTVDVQVQISNMFSDTKRKVLYDDVEDKEELLKRIEDLENILRPDVSQEVKEGKIKSALSWLGTKGKNTMQLLMPLIQLILEKNL